MPLPLEVQPLPLRNGADDVIFVGRTRVPLATVIGAYLTGDNPEEIVNSYPSLDLGEVYSVLGYYLSHREPVDAYLAAQARRAAQARSEVEAQFPPAGIKARLLARRVARSSVADASSDSTHPQ